MGLASQSYAEGISESTLSAMGLSGATIVSDFEADQVRGLGFDGGKKGGKK